MHMVPELMSFKLEKELLNFSEIVPISGSNKYLPVAGAVGTFTDDSAAAAGKRVWPAAN